ncbi:TetR family transcriptional regulator [Leifsonia shinshuensis]|uniref:TetR/AcrR family transcriptional regulator n=1 Tax=Leifsonia shinshuensis TaxID=150026 RepID=UPI00285EA243|nr:TetR family transcriptional regulator [Leifsonia shinshuensis]MDR6971114.1 AcrR family transcriptional regulator [Leifsonia shinshuensis]
MSELAERRRPGRPRKERGAASARSAILRAAADEFAERGYEAASLRAVARRAGVDSALVHHYFDGKADLFAATLEVPLRPDRVLDVVLAGPRDRVGESLVRYILERLDDEKSARRMVVVLRTVLGSGPGTRMVREFLQREVLSKLASLSDAPDASLRGELAAAQLVGIMMTRYALQVEPIASTPAEDLARRVGPVLQWHLFGDPDAPVS